MAEESSLVIIAALVGLSLGALVGLALGFLLGSGGTPQLAARTGKLNIIRDERGRILSVEEL